MRWFVWALVAVICWGAWALIARLIGDSISPAQSQALSTIGLLPVMALLMFSVRKQNAGVNKGYGIALGCAAGVLTCVGNIAYYYVLNSGTKASTVVPLTALYPLVTVLLALIFLQERLNKIQIAGVCLSIVAIYAFNIQREQGLLSKWLLLAFLPIVLWGVSGFAQKLSTNHVSGELSALSFLAVFVPIAMIILVMEPLKSDLPPRIWWLSAALGFCFAWGNFAILQAFANNGKASIIAPLGGLYPLISVPVAMVAFKEKLGIREAIGILTASLAIIALSLETRHPATEVSRPEPVLK